MANPNGFQIFLCESALRKQGAALQQYADLTAMVSAGKFDNHAQGGFGTFTCSVVAPLIYLEWLYDMALGLHIEVRDRYLNSVYEGIVQRVDLSAGNAHRSLSLDQLINRVVVYFGNNNHHIEKDDESIARWGKKAYVHSLGADEDRQGAQRWAQNYLAEHLSPIVPIPSSAGGYGTQVQLILTAQGYWWTLGWLYYRGREGRFDTATLMRLVLKSAETEHGYLASDYSDMPISTGITRKARTRDAVTAQQRLLRLLNIGNATNSVRLMGGVTQNRTMRVFPRPTTSDYFYDAWDDTFRDSAGQVIPKHTLAAGRFATSILNFNAARHISDVKSDPFSVFLKTVRYDMDTDRVEFDPPDAISILKRFSRPSYA